MEPDDTMVDLSAFDDDASVIFESAKKFESLPVQKDIDDYKILSILTDLEDLYLQSVEFNHSSN